MVVSRKFEQMAALYANHIAVEGGAGKVSYAKLNEAANKLAYLLKTLGAEKGALTGVLAHADIWLPAIMLGIYKAGAVYVPLDLAFSENRFRKIFTSTFDGILVCQPGMEDTAKALLAPYREQVEYLIVIHTDISPVVWQPREDGWNEVIVPAQPVYSDPDTTPDEKDSAYVFFTSGSTGEGKGILGRHDSLAHFINWATGEFKTSPGFRFGHLSQPTFDASLLDMLVPLCAGGTLCFPVAGIKEGIPPVIRWLQEAGIHAFQTVPSIFRSLLAGLEELNGKETPFPELQFVILDGEVLFARDIMQWRAKAGTGTEIINMYGTTESTILDTFHRIKDIPANPADPLHVGQPISHTLLLIVNNDKLCRIGETGDVYVKTPYLTKGYINEPGLTADAFVQNPLIKDRTDIVYRTGDLGFYLEDRSVQIVGRKDKQIKVNGIRIELEEIEKALRNADGILQSAVIVHEATDGQKSLIAYYQATGIPEAELRESLGKKLNANMMPGFLIAMESWPLNINGKLDKKSLPLPEEIAAPANAEALPQGETETRLEKIWQETLGVRKRIDRNVSFFQTGGDSLRAVQLGNRIYKTFNTEIRIADLFLNQSISKQAEWLQQHVPTDFSPIVPVPEQEYYDVSPSQRRLWILSQIGQGQIAYNIHAAYEIEGELDREAFTTALQCMMERHESLRTIFIEKNGEPKQKVLKPEEIILPLRWTTEPDRSKTGVLVHQYLHEYFELSKGPLLQITIVHQEEGRYLFLANVSHIIIDGWSTGVFIHELMAYYESIVAGKDPYTLLSPLKIQYRDYVEWQRRLQTSTRWKTDRKYWHDRFEVLPVPLQLPADKPAVNYRSYNGNTITIQLSAALTEDLRSFSQAKGITLFSVLTAAVKSLLFRYSGQQDITVGFPAAGREHYDLEGQVGLYINMLPLRTKFGDDITFEELACLIGKNVEGALEHSAYPFDLLVSELKMDRDSFRSPLFDVMVVLQNFEYERLDGSIYGNFRLNELPINVNGSKFDLTFTFYETVTGDMMLSVQYSTDIFSKDRIDMILEHFGLLTAELLKNSTQVVRMAGYLTPAEKELVRHYNDTDFPFSDLPLHRLFEQTAAIHPDRKALTDENGELTFEMLNRKANQVARVLQEQFDIGTGDVAGISLEPDNNMIIVILAVLKLGATYLPVDPSYPASYVEYMLTDAGAKVLVGVTIAIDTLLEQAAAQPETNLPLTVTSDDIAYIIYTSGSTGKPKGTMMAHRGVASLVQWTWQHYGFTGNDIILQKTPFVFDVSVWEIFMPVCMGAQMVICSRKVAKNAESIMEQVYRHKVTTLHFVPSMFAVFLNMITPGHVEQLGTLKYIFTAGETLNPETAKLHYQLLEHVQLHNLYGPTETCVFGSYYPVSKDDEVIPIGKPMGNYRIYVVDKWLQPVPPGIPGSIVMAGAGIAKGYKGKDVLTKKMFLPASQLGEDCIYRTMDGGTLTRDGLLLFNGREDQQVKIKGYRIEIGAIENVMLEYPAITDAVAIVVDSGTGSKQLHAFYMSRETVEKEQLYTYLSEKLPEYMIPAVLCQVEQLPRLISGKIDRKLLERDHAKYTAIKEQTSRLPADEIESALLEVWSGVLKKDNVDVTDNFFQVGGDSLSVIILSRKIASIYPGMVEIHDIFSHSSVQKLAAFIRNKMEPVEIVNSERVNKVEF